MTAIAAGSNHSLALKSDGTVVGWGSDWAGQATPPAGLTGVVAVAAAEIHSLALKSDGTVVGWGADWDGQATPPAGLSNVTAIDAGSSHSLALKSDGTVVGWGADWDGQATPPAGLSDVTAIAAGSNHSLALKSDGTVVGWGADWAGQATPPAGLSDVVAIAAGLSHSLALKADGTVVGWGDNEFGQATPPADLSNVTAIAAGGSHNLALKADGAVVGWGNDNFGQVTPPAGLSAVVAISAGEGHSLALATNCNNPPDIGVDNASMTGQPGQTAVNTGTVSDIDGDAVTLSASVGTVVNNGDGTWSWSFTPSSLGVLAVTITADDGNFRGMSQTSFFLYVTLPGTCVIGWGDNSYGQATPPLGLSDVTAIAAGSEYSLALKADGTVVGWGNNDFGQATPPAGLSGVVAIAAAEFTSLALKADGTVVGWGNNDFGQATPPDGLSDVVAIDTDSLYGIGYSLALKSDGTVVGWGTYDYGTIPPPDGLSGVVAISAGTTHSLALKADGTVVGWGQNSLGQATPPAGLTDVVAISAGNFYSLALKADGTVVGWGANSFGQAAPPAGLSDVVAISAGDSHSLALKADGTVVGWGNTFGSGAETPPAGLSGVVAIAAGWSYSLALTTNCASPNTAPVAVALAFVFNQDTSVDITLHAWDADNDPLTYSIVAQPAHGTLSGTAPNLTYTPNAGYYGSDSFTYLANDGQADSNVARVFLDVRHVNHAPVAAADTYTTNEDTPLTVPAPGVLGNDTDADGDPLTAQPVTSPAHGTLLLNTDGSFSYTPAADFSGTDSFTYLANDGQVNSNIATVNITVVDTTAPTITITTPAEGAVYTRGDVVNADYACQDEAGGSGLSSCTGDVPNGSAIDTSLVGDNTFTVNATDNAGNPSSLTHTYSVYYNASFGNNFGPPIDTVPTLNLMKAGGSVPVKFDLGGDFGLNILASGYPISRQVTCDTNAPVDLIEETTTSPSGLTYDPATGQYVYVWKTQKSWAGTCRQFTLRLNDGSNHFALFQFK